MPESQPFTPLRQLPAHAPWKAGDVLVVFGELFSRGYANGLVDEAMAAGLTVVRSTVGRRDSDGSLRPLDATELAAQPKPLINVALEAGFDLERAESGRTPVDQLQGVKMSEWDKVRLNWDEVEDSRARGAERFRKACALYMRELETLIPKGANVLFAHTMAGGVPRAKILMPTMNRVFKGTGDRHESSERFWASDLGRLSSMNFDEVTANTFAALIEASAQIRTRTESQGGHVSYVAFGYHGTEIRIDGADQWQTYTPYVQGWAKMNLERFAREAAHRGVRACVFNCPEILTNSSSIFLGVEVSLYPLLGALEKRGSERARALLKRCAALLRTGETVGGLLAACDAYMTSKLMREFNVYSGWPRHNRRDQMEGMLAVSAKLIGMHEDEKDLITYVLSEEVFKATGYLMFHESWAPRSPVVWLGHDCIAEVLAGPDAPAGA